MGDSKRYTAFQVGLIFVYLAVASANVIGLLLEIKTLDYITQPLFMPLLMLYMTVLSHNRKDSLFITMFVALIAAWAGDCLLLGESDELLYAGMAAFLIMHILYSITFARLHPRWTIAKTIGAILYLAAAIALTVYVAGHVSIMVTIFVLIYALGFGTMATLAIGLGPYGVVGALLFAICDSSIAISTFVDPLWLPKGNVWVESLIITVYAIGQLLLITGFIQSFRKRKPRQAKSVMTVWKPE